MNNMDVSIPTLGVKYIYRGDEYRGVIHKLQLPAPKMGSKGWVLEQFGNYLLEDGPGILRGLACTHTGSGSLELIDGIVDETTGFYPTSIEILQDHLHPKYHSCNGRRIFFSSGSVMGMWYLGIGFHHGLTLHARGGLPSAPPCVTIMWDKQSIIKKED